MRSKKALLNIITALLLQIVVITCGFIVPRMIIGTFGSSVNGLLESITQFLAFITLLESGFGPVVKSVLYKPIARKDKGEIENILRASERFFRNIAKIFLIYLVILCVIYPFMVISEFDYGFTVSLLLIMAISTFAEYYFGMTYRLYLQAEQKTYITSLIQMVTVILNTMAIVVLIHFGASIQVVKIITAIIFVLRPILQNIYVKKKYNINLKEANREVDIKQKWDGLAQHIAAVVHNNTDVAILTLFSNTIQVSIYAVYMLVVKGVKSLVSAFTDGIDASFGDMLARGEKEQLNKSFKVYELFFFTINTIIFTSTMILIVPFVGVYTKGITDANYIVPVFGTLIVLAEFMHSIRLPYSSITLAAGHFKETMKGAWIEAGVNIILSTILVINFGIIGVAIGTLVSMFIRTIEFMYHTSKYILERSMWYTFFRLIVILVEVLIIVGITYLIGFKSANNYMDWLMYALIIGIISTLVVGTINLIVYHNETKGLMNMLKRMLKKDKEHV